MKQQDIEMLSPSERELLDASFQPDRVRLRYRSILIGAGVMLAGIFIAAASGLGAIYLALIGAGFVIAAAAEKLTYARVMLQFEGLVQKLAHRIEQLEGTRLTPLEGEPTRLAAKERGPSSSDERSRAQLR
jgi:hypothetical protein